MVADILTKPLSGPKQVYCVHEMGIEGIVTACVNVQIKVVKCGFTFKEHIPALFMLRGLPKEKYENFIHTMEYTNHLELDKVVSKLMVEEEKQNRIEGDSLKGDDVKAMSTFRKNQGNSNSSKKRNHMTQLEIGEIVMRQNFTSMNIKEKHGIVHRKTVPYCPQQNGVVAKKNSTLVDMVRCMMIEVNVPKNFWTEAMLIAAFIKNRCNSSRAGNQTPFGLWNRYRITEEEVKRIKVFGYRAWIMKMYEESIFPFKEYWGKLVKELSIATCTSEMLDYSSLFIEDGEDDDSQIEEFLAVVDPVQEDDPVPLGKT
ncbi:hypothetical protein PR048_001220 [Dryococelus australis]|uniref:Integrase catalytic domain-containing protein n=1 Tax=Dryococelus australis TaxID=614101 RepID=A0ABQ9IGS2_9NEOP|nr:hypothetical protein PR048_001220 [Dryococelus australis]